MTKYYTAIIILFGLSIQISKGQSEKKLDSLFKLLNESNVDTNQLRLNHKLGIYIPTTIPIKL